ncbi:MAG: hypothetical protein CM15mV24_0300 [Bellamyvirus sp.]|nr:MAG: hypothetical protein CM15mV24_0300 [Bellamyvirus sp.]
MEKDIETHIEKDKKILEDPTISPQMRRHTADELEHLERYAKEHAKEIAAGDHHDPLHLKCIVMKIQKQTSVGFTKIDVRNRSTI